MLPITPAPSLVRLCRSKPPASASGDSAVFADKTCSVAVHQKSNMMPQNSVHVVKNIWLRFFASSCINKGLLHANDPLLDAAQQF